MHVRRHSRAPLHFARSESTVEEAAVELHEERVNVGSRIEQLVRRIHQAAHRFKNAARRLSVLRPPSPSLSTSSLRSMTVRLSRSHQRGRESLQYTSLIEDDQLADESYID